MELYTNLIFGCRQIRGATVRIFVWFAALLLTSAFITPPVVLSRSVDVIQSDATTFHFRLSLSASDLDWLAEQDSSLTAYTTVQVGIPYGVQPSLRSAQGQAVEALEEEVYAPARLSAVSYPLAALGAPNTFRGRQIVGLRVYPVLNGEMVTQIEIKVDFQGGAALKGGPPNDPVFDRIFSAVVANFDQFRAWPVGPGTAPRSQAMAAGPFAEAGPWIKLSVNQTGLYRINGSTLSGANGSIIGVASSSLRLFNGGGKELPVRNDSPRPTLVELPIIVEDGGDGVFNQGDYILFFGESQDRWVFEADVEPRFVEHHYSDCNVYWLHSSAGTSGLRMASVSSSAGGAAVSDHTAWVHVEQNNTLLHFYDGTIYDYYNWYWSGLESVSFYVSTPLVVAGEDATIRLTGIACGDYYSLEVNGVDAERGTCFARECEFTTDRLMSGANRMDVEMSACASAPPHLNAMEISYRAFNEPQSNRFDLTAGQFTGITEFEVANSFASTPIIVDVSNPISPVRITGASVGGSWITFGVESDSSVFCRYFLSSLEGTYSPISVESVTLPDLYAAGTQTDVFVIAPSVLTAALEEWVQYRRADGLSIQVTTVENIMDNFAFGLYDPTAIRDFLKYAYENYPEPAPATVLLVGDGNYDYLNHLSTGLANYVPPYLHGVNAQSSDDDYVFFGSYGLLDSDTSYDVSVDRGFDMTISRWPVRTISEIATITEKTIGYEAAANFGIWRNSITLVADDQYTTSETTEWVHTEQTEQLAKYHTPIVFNRDKIYAIEYPFVNNNKPAVNDAIVKAFNDGRLIVNYVGHGNPDQWAHERIFSRGDDLPRLTNADHLPLVFVASCAIGFFDDPIREGMAEDLLAMSSGGAIGTISATRSVFSSPNAEFNQEVYDVLLTGGSLSMAEAMYAAKIARQYASGFPQPVTNDRMFLYFGDPCCRLGVPQLQVEFISAPDTLVALSPTRISGRVVDDEMNPYVGDGVLSVHVYDSERDKVYRAVDASGSVIKEIHYTVAGPTIFRGSATITDGQFSFDFVPPLDIGYGGTGASVSAYARFDDIDGAGIADSIAVSDSIAILADSTGPSIEVSFVGRNDFASGDFISKSEQLQLIISDPSGVNSTGAVGHGITLEIDGQSENMINLTSLYEAALDDYTTGSLVYPLAELEAGVHHFKVKAWDNANNSTSYEFDAQVLAGEGLAIRDLLNYPNPMRESTRFSFYLTERAEKFSLELFTLSGRKIKSFYRYSLDPGYYDDIEWYGRDAAGGRVATEVYIYKATAYPAGGGETAESIGKLVLIN